MDRKYLNDLAAVLTDKHGLPRKDAQTFVTSVVEAIQKGLEEDRLVKVRGLGTFKVIEVEARQSVNVNTGERHLIESHSRLTFLPDAAMKELVNKPFSAFETVMLNDGVDFRDMTPEMTSELVDSLMAEASAESADMPLAAEEGEAPAEEQPDAQPEPAAAENPGKEEAPAEAEAPLEVEFIDDETPAAEEKFIADETPAAEEGYAADEYSAAEEKYAEGTAILIGEPDSEEEPAVGEPAEALDEDEHAASGKNRLRWLSAAIAALAVIGLAAWLILRPATAGHPAAKQQPAVEATAVQDQQPEQKKPSAQEASSAKEEPSAPGEQAAQDEPSAPGEQAAEETQPANGEQPVWQKYDSMDKRLSIGAYYIMGEDYTIKAQKGDTSRRIAKRVFGYEDACCYIEVFNGIGSSDVLEAGREVKIPKLKNKNKVKKDIKQ